jgi:hypothetical protein
MTNYVLLQTSPCGGGVEYLHRDPASRKRRRNGKSQIWDTKIWSQVQRGSDQRMTALARTNSNCKRQTRPLVRESAPQKQYRNCQTEINICSWSPDWARHQDILTDWSSVAMWLWLWLWLLQTMTLTKDRPVLSSERAPHNNKNLTVKR